MFLSGWGRKRLVPKVAEPKVETESGGAESRHFRRRKVVDTLDRHRDWILFRIFSISRSKN